MTRARPVQTIMGVNPIAYASSKFDQTAVDAMTAYEAGSHANMLFSLIKNANILKPWTTYPGSVFPADVQALIDALQRLRTKAGGGSVPSARA